MCSRAREDEALALLGSTAQSDANDSHQRQIDRQKLAEQVFRQFFGERNVCVLFMCHFHFPNRISHFDSFEYDADYLKDSHHRHKKTFRASFLEPFFVVHNLHASLSLSQLRFTLCCVETQSLYFLYSSALSDASGR